MTEAVEAQDVVFSYGRRRVLDGASWRVSSGVNALLGPNGAGKTTLIKCLIGEHSVASGQVLLGGRPVQAPGIREQIGYVPQRPTLPGLARVRDIVAYAAWLSGLDSHAVGSAVERALSQMDLSDLGRRRVRTLSGGQRQRVALATGIVHEPQVLFLDEPTVGLDPGQRLKVRQVIQALGRDRPVVLSTHMTEDVEHLATSVAVLVSGRIQFTGALADLELSRHAADGDLRPGSDFERAYDDMVVRFGGGE